MSIKIDHLTHIYNEGTPFQKVALEDINMSIEKGEFVGIIGHTGSGKSTLIQMFNGLLKPTKGEVYVNQQNIHGEKINKKEMRQRVGLVFQYPEYQLFEMTVKDDVAFGPKNMGLTKEEIDKQVKFGLDAVGLDESYYEKSPFELSGGQKRRVAIAGVLAMNPEILILDEPTAGLDPKGRNELFEQLKKMHQELGLTIVLISHSMEDVAKYVEKLFVLYKGRIAYTGSPREVFAHGKELEKIGLAMPQIKYIMEDLKQKGMDIDTDVLTVEEAAAKIIAYLKEKGEQHD
ncbi:MULTISPECIES: energy-coupling factor transporter ATPase [Cellulosilyticum]|uniref:Energy-coupling factor transporter ATP-binding protein EcfA2 n=1 Tax=Cellulosilyticum lentocellum (strain ATCC 49066 / DSM 5427 / NCIMB 11756 / RHM5) TaxID=642492 RepID=F2JSG0_CELLD|nr:MULTISPECIES: energy-coupling factor transporter ATPase [Cellulosilyticum]ADZ85198.1 Polyamine-transporting ATPase [Cellulosilyticum lentocellum DSM 5427]QEH70756.1 energy-coupling factor transporter ATPase [Cellulosilyticum sp. WCF-2]